MPARDLVGLVHNPKLPEAASLVDSVVASLGLKDRCWIRSAGDVGDVRDRLDRTALIVVFGGDGTILRTARVVAPFGVPIVGINMGRVGFMSELTVDEVVGKLPAYLEGGPRIEERMMLQASVVSDSERATRLTMHALNDVVVGGGVAARLVDIDVSVDGVPLTGFRADAVIVSTATGSTGYALSAGGPILYPEAQVMLVQPVAAHTGLRDGLILPEQSTVRLSARGEDGAILSVDGTLGPSLSADDGVQITRSRHVARFLRAHTPNAFYADLTRRLGRASESGWPGARP